MILIYSLYSVQLMDVSVSKKCTVCRRDMNKFRLGQAFSCKQKIIDGALHLTISFCTVASVDDDFNYISISNRKLI